MDTYIEKIENNKIDVSVHFCSNNDNRSCEPIDISSVKKINLECQAIFLQWLVMSLNQKNSQLYGKKNNLFKNLKLKLITLGVSLLVMTGCSHEYTIEPGSLP